MLQITQDQTLIKVIQAARPAVVESLREDAGGIVFNPRDKRIASYVIAQMQGEREEQLHAVYLDRNCCYLLDERIASGGWSKIAVRIRPVLRRAIEIDAAWITLLHNHPSGDPRPSAADVQFTDQIRQVAQSLGIGIFDHLIVSGPSIYSMRAAGGI